MVDQRDLKLIKIQQRIEEVEKDGKGKVVIYIERNEIKSWQTVKDDCIKESLINKSKDETTK